MAEVVINKDKCKGCLLCVGVCPSKALIIDEQLNQRGNKPVKFRENSVCTGCGQCYIVCPDTAIEVSD